MDEPKHSPRTLRFLNLAALIARAIRGDIPASVLLDQLLDAAIETADAERAFIVAVDAKGKLTLVRMRNFDASISNPDRDYIFSRTAVRAALADGKPLVSEDVRDDPRFEESDTVDSLDLQRLIVQPLILDQKLLGVLVLDSRRAARHPYTEIEVELLGALAAQAAFTLERMREEILREAEEAARQAQTPRHFHRIVGNARLMQPVFRLLERAAQTSATVLIRGETGSGKEVIARTLHEESDRRQGPFAAFSVADVSATLMESALFGHEKGAFTGADQTHKGHFERADGGTLFIDEIGEATPELQTKLLRVLEERKLRRLGGKQSIPVDVRVIAATHRDLQAMVRQGTFRQDLYYRLNVVQVELPPLRDRPEDIPLLAAHFLEAFAAKEKREVRKLSTAALEKLMGHPWSGNVRELKNVLERALVLADAKIGPQHIVIDETSPAAQGLAMEELKLMAFKKQLELHDYKVKAAAKALGVSETTGYAYRNKLHDRGHKVKR